MAYRNSDPMLYGLILAALFGLLPLFPQMIYPDFQFGFRSLIFLLLGLCIYRLGASAVYKSFRRQSLVWPVLAVNAFFLVGIAYTPVIYEALTKFTNIFTITLLYLVLLNAPLSQRRINALCWALVLGGGLAAIHALWTQWQGHDELIRQLANTPLYDARMTEEMQRSLRANRAMGRFGNPNHLAGYLVLALWPIWFLIRRVSSSLPRGFLFFLGLLLCVGVYATYSRSGLVALGLSLAVMVARPWLARHRAIPWKPIVTILGLGVALLAGAVYLIPENFFGGRLATISTLVARWHFFRGGFAIIQDYPLLGVGPMGYESFYAAYLRPGDVEARFVHNLLIESAVEGGVIGCFLFLWTVSAFFLSLRRRWLTVLHRRDAVTAALGTGLVFLWLSLVDFHNNLVEMWVVPAFFTALALQTQLPHESTKPLQPIMKWGTALLIVAVWVFCVLARYQNQLAREEGLIFAIEQRYSRAITAYQRAVFYERSDAESWNSLGKTWANIPTQQGRRRWLECLRSATAWEPRSATFRSDFADALFALGYIDQALQQNQKAISLFPARPVYYQQRARFLAQLGREDEAAQLRQQAQNIQQQIEARSL